MSTFADSLYKAIKETVHTGGQPYFVGPVYLIGNGGSAAIASHIATDLNKNGTEAHTLTDPAVFSAFANDYGYENAFMKMLPGHRCGTLVAISSSGNSDNIIQAVSYAHVGGTRCITFSGFDMDNRLRKLSTSLEIPHYYIPSHNYGIVEIAHLTILHSLVNPGVY